LELAHCLRVRDAIFVHMQHEIFELNFHAQFSFLHSSIFRWTRDKREVVGDAPFWRLEAPQFPVAQGFSRPCRLRGQRNSHCPMWFIVSGLQTLEVSVPENCAA
jgi:hypothetical protein